LGCFGSGPSFPRAGNSVVGLAQPNWDVGGPIREKLETLARIKPELFQPGNNGGQLKDNHNELKRVDVDVTRG
jgi:hypothetical protein